MKIFYHGEHIEYRPKRPLTLRLLYIFLIFAQLCPLVLISQAGCSRDTPIRLGFAGGLTGHVADLGISGRNGAILAVEQRNSIGGIQGKPVRLFVEDDGQNKQTAVEAATALLEQGVAAIIGHMTSSMSAATVPLANSARVVMMSPTTTTTELSGLDDYFFRVCATTDIYAAKMARYFREQRKLNKVTLIYDLDNRAYTESWTNYFNEEFSRLGGTIVQTVTFTSGPPTSFSQVARQALLLDTDGLIIAASAADAAMLCQQFRKLNVTLPIGTSEWAGTEKLIELGGRAVENVVVGQFFDRYSTEPGYLKFKENFKNRFGQEPGFASVGAYDATNVILDALAARKSGQDLKQTILDIGTFKGLQGKIRFDPYGDSTRETYLSQVKGGQFVKIDSADRS